MMSLHLSVLIIASFIGFCQGGHDHGENLLIPILDEILPKIFGMETNPGHRLSTVLITNSKQNFFQEAIIKNSENRNLPILSLNSQDENFEGNPLVEGYSARFGQLTGFGLIFATLGEEGYQWSEIDLISRSFPERLVVLVDMAGRGSMTPPWKIRSRTVLIRHPGILQFFCPGGKQIQAQVLRKEYLIKDPWVVFKDCPSPLEGQTPVVSTIGSNPYVLATFEKPQNGRRIKVPILEEGTGNNLGVDFDITQLVCSRLRTNHFKLVTLQKFDFFDRVRQRWMGRVGTILDGQADFAVGFPGIRGPEMEVIDITNWVHVNVAGFSGGHSQLISPLFNIVRPFR